MIEVTARYFAAFRERAGREREVVATTATTAAELYDELAERYGFKDAMSRCKVAINDELVDWDAALRPGDEVLFFPPVAGG
ncbi:MAG TPA: molybdopterin converting factor subunit 1 [Gammaproteobacteria bacterium]